MRSLGFTALGTSEALTEEDVLTPVTAKEAAVADVDALFAGALFADASFAATEAEEASMAFKISRVRVTSSWNFFTSFFLGIFPPPDVIFVEDAAAPLSSNEAVTSDEDAAVDGAAGGT